ncbi:MAG: choice-of-anchor tandem repeat GloVer-containing protein [Terriglobales bacterium]
MNRKSCPRWVIRLALSFLVVLAFASVASASWKEKVLYSFQGIPDGATPAGGVVFDQAGNLYTATTNGGSSTCHSVAQCGTVVQLAPPLKQGGRWTETVLYVFKGNTSNDGATPAGGVLLDSAGNLYGTTAYGGTGNCTVLGGLMGCGTVFKLSPPNHKGGAWTETVLYSFQGGKDGDFPSGDLVFDAAGNLYGATLFGGGKGTTCNAIYGFCGTAFELSPPKKKGGAWKEKVLHRFAGGTDGGNPNGALVFDSKGALYGTTQIGGDLQGECSPNGCGELFKVSPPVTKGGIWSEKVLHRFTGLDGAAPAAGITFGGNGDLYCATAAGGGGNFPSGTVVQLVPHANGTWTAHILHSFQDNGDGGQPQATLVFDTKGNLNGTASGGGSFGGGTLFRLRPKAGGGWGFTAVYDFQAPPDGFYPAAGSTFDKTGSVFGTTQDGGTGQACQGGRAARCSKRNHSRRRKRTVARRKA